MPFLQRNAKQDRSSLDAYLRAVDARSVEQCLDRLLDEEARPVIVGILRGKLGAHPQQTGREHTSTRQQEDVDDLHGDICAQVIGRLRALREDSEAAPIHDFGSYVAVTTYNAVRQHLRSRYPKRFSLENRLRYLLERGSGLTLWKTNRGEWFAGFAAWKDDGRAADEKRLRPIVEGPEAFMRTALPGQSANHIDPGDLVAAIFQGVGSPMPLDDLVRIVAALWGVQDLPDEPPPMDDLMESTDESVEAVTIQRVDLRGYWDRICLLPVKQRAALLLQAHDPNGNSLLELLEMQGIATVAEMAEAIGMTQAALLEHWNDIPLDDARIARHLEISTQHSARLRMIARQRLSVQATIME